MYTNIFSFSFTQNFFHLLHYAFRIEYDSVNNAMFSANKNMFIVFHCIFVAISTSFLILYEIKYIRQNT